MISINDALSLLEKEIVALPIRTIHISQALGLILAEDIISPIDMPPFRQSAMDGYALNFSSQITTYKVVAEIAAGDNNQHVLNEGEAARIFTGGAVPDSANTVIQQELVLRDKNEISFTKEIQSNQNIRKQGEQIKVGEIALKKGAILNPAAIGFLAGLGIENVAVFSSPKIAVLATGNELVQPGTALQHGQIFESNSIMLSSAIKNYLNLEATILFAKDDLTQIQNALTTLIEAHDVVLISGGISVGDYDFVKSALENIGVKELFYKVKQKPGKPIYAATKNEKLIFALPGNPASALTCFLIYAIPSLQKMMGNTFNGLKKSKRLLENSYAKRSGLGHFLKANANDKFVKILESQSSAMLNSFAAANALVFLPEDCEAVNSNEEVDVYFLD